MKDNSLDKEKCLELFLLIGLDERTARNTIANNKVTANLTAVINEVCSFCFQQQFAIVNVVGLMIQ